MNYKEDLLILYRDGSEEQVSLQFSDWWEEEPFFKESIALSANCCRKKDGNIEQLGNKVYIFAKAIKVNYQKEVASIKLPELSNIHIFAISLQAKDKTK